MGTSSSAAATVAPAATWARGKLHMASLSAPGEASHVLSKSKLVDLATDTGHRLSSTYGIHLCASRGSGLLYPATGRAERLRRDRLP